MKPLIVLFFFSMTFFSIGQEDSLKLNQELGEVVISTNAKGSNFYSKKDHFILDMIEDSTGLIVLLKKRERYFLEKVNWNGFVSMSEKLSFKVSSITKDCLGNLYLERSNGYQRFHVDKSTLNFDEMFSLSSYKSEIEPCVASANSRLLFKSLSDHNQSIYLWTFDFNNDSTQTVYLYKDSVSIHSNKDEKRIIRGENYTNHERMGDITVPELELLKDEQERAMFFNTIVTQVPYCPTFSFNGQHHFFNFEIDSIYSFNDAFELLAESKSPIKKDTKAEILLDQKTGEFYTINLDKFSIEKFKIGNPGIAEKINSKGVRSSKKVIYNDVLFFMGKSSVNDSFNRIFREKL